MEIHITKDGQQLGPFTLAQVNTALAGGELSPDDLAWHEGAPGWIMLGAVDGVVAPALRPPMPPPPPAEKMDAPVSESPWDLLHQKFPDLEPISDVPSLWEWGALGVGMWGRRDFDPDTVSYTKTQCITLMFLPVFAVEAYRVIEDEERAFLTPPALTFVGRHRLSAFARSWNWVVGLGFFMWLGWVLLGVFRK